MSESWWSSIKSAVVDKAEGIAHAAVSAVHTVSHVASEAAHAIADSAVGHAVAKVGEDVGKTYAEVKIALKKGDMNEAGKALSDGAAHAAEDAAKIKGAVEHDVVHAAKATADYTKSLGRGIVETVSGGAGGDRIVAESKGKQLDVDIAVNNKNDSSLRQIAEEQYEKRTAQLVKIEQSGESVDKAEVARLKEMHETAQSKEPLSKEAREKLALNTKTEIGAVAMSELKGVSADLGTAIQTADVTEKGLKMAQQGVKGAGVAIAVKLTAPIGGIGGSFAESYFELVETAGDKLSKAVGADNGPRERNAITKFALNEEVTQGDVAKLMVDGAFNAVAGKAADKVEEWVAGPKGAAAGTKVATEEIAGETQAAVRGGEAVAEAGKKTLRQHVGKLAGKVTDKALEKLQDKTGDKVADALEKLPVRDEDMLGRRIKHAGKAGAKDAGKTSGGEMAHHSAGHGQHAAGAAHAGQSAEVEGTVAAASHAGAAVVSAAPASHSHANAAMGMTAAAAVIGGSTIGNGQAVEGLGGALAQFAQSSGAYIENMIGKFEKAVISLTEGHSTSGDRMVTGHANGAVAAATSAAENPAARKSGDDVAMAFNQFIVQESDHNRVAAQTTSGKGGAAGAVHI